MSVRRIAGLPIETDSGDRPIRANRERWTKLLAELATEQPCRAFIFWPKQQGVKQ